MCSAGESVETDPRSPWVTVTCGGRASPASWKKTEPLSFIKTHEKRKSETTLLVVQRRLRRQVPISSHSRVHGLPSKSAAGCLRLRLRRWVSDFGREGEN